MLHHLVPDQVEPGSLGPNLDYYGPRTAHGRRCPQAWEQEFLARYCALPGARLELRSGAAAEYVAKVAGAEQAYMIALAWSQRLDPGRAAAPLSR
jgi:hypothetical protein